VSDLSAGFKISGIRRKRM